MLGEVERGPRRRGPRRHRAHRHGPEREPLVGHPERRAALLLAEQRRRDPARREPLRREREEQVLDRGAAREQEHLPFGVRAFGVGVGVGAPEPDPRDDQDRRGAEHPVAPRDPAFDRGLGCPVAAEILAPGVRDRAEQPPLRRRAPDRAERPRSRVMRRRRRARGPNRLLHRLARHLAVPERPDRPPLRDRQERGRSEQVLLGRPDRLGHRDRRRLERHAPHDRDRHPRRLAHREPARGRHLVGERHDRRLELAAVVVGGPAEVDERRDARAADRDVHDPATPGPAERVRDHDGDLDAEPFAQLAAEPLRRAVRVLRQQREEPLLDVGGVDARVRAHEPVAGLGDHEVAAPGDEAPRLPLDPGLAAAVGLGDHTALGLGHDLLRHRDHVAVANAHRAQRSGEERREVVARPDLREPLDGQHLDAHAVRDAPITRAGRARTGRAPPPSRRRS